MLASSGFGTSETLVGYNTILWICSFYSLSKKKKNVSLVHSL